MTREQNGNRCRPLAIVVVTLHVAAASSCIDLFGALPCDDDSNCPPSLACVESRCVEPIVPVGAIPCDDDSNCSGSLVCVGSQCVEAIDPVDVLPCDNDSNCSGLLVCVETRCVEPTVCDSVCASGEVCGDGGTCTQVQCQTPEDCPDDGSVCTDEVCVIEASGCAETCTTGLTCDEVFEVCLAGDVFEGDFVVETLIELEELRAYRRVTGTIFVGLENGDDNSLTDIAGFTDFNLELLTQTAGLWVWGQSSLLRMQMPALRGVGPEGVVVSQNNALTSISLPSLIAGPLNIFGMESLVEIHLDRLRAVGEDVDFRVLTLPLLEVLSAPELQIAHTMSLQYLGTPGGETTTILLPTLGSVNTMSITDSPTLDDVTLPALTTVTGQLFIGNNFGITALLLPSLLNVTEKLTVERNPVLVTVDVTPLVHIGALTVIFNDALCTDGLFDAIIIDGITDVSNNGTCP